MTSNPFDHQWMRRTKWLTQALIISGTLNIGLCATFINFVLKDKHNPVTFELKPLAKNPKITGVAIITNENLLRTYSNASFQDLLLRLEDPELVEEGLTKRDLALACLVAFHHFNLERALGGLVLQPRQIAFTSAGGDETIDLAIFPGLADYQFQAIIRYAKTEKWPLTSSGLFYEIKTSLGPCDASLLEAFYLTPEFHSIATLFAKSGLNLEKNALVKMVAQGEWKIAHEFNLQQRQSQDLSPTRRSSLLLDYLNCRSPLAAKALLETDPEFVSKRLDDAQILVLLDVLTDRTAPLETFAVELLSSPRSDEVLKTAAVRLYSFVGEPLPEPYEHAAALRRFSPKTTAGPDQTEESSCSLQQEPVRPKAVRIYVVQPNDNLWKIARKYRVSIDAIMQANHLESERIRPGKQLEIPEH